MNKINKYLLTGIIYYLYNCYLITAACNRNSLTKHDSLCKPRPKSTF